MMPTPDAVPLNIGQEDDFSHVFLSAAMVFASHESSLVQTLVLDGYAMVAMIPNFGR
jgi:hypothetical protein